MTVANFVTDCLVNPSDEREPDFFCLDYKKRANKQIRKINALKLKMNKIIKNMQATPKEKKYMLLRDTKLMNIEKKQVYQNKPNLNFTQTNQLKLTQNGDTKNETTKV
jgi:hypothetical protein